MKCKGNDLKIFILFYGYYCETFQYHPLILVINTKKHVPIYIIKGRIHMKKTVKSITFMKKHTKKR